MITLSVTFTTTAYPGWTQDICKSDIYSHCFNTCRNAVITAGLLWLDPFFRHLLFYQFISTLQTLVQNIAYRNLSKNNPRGQHGLQLLGLDPEKILDLYKAPALT